VSFRAIRRLAMGLLIGGCVAWGAGNCWGQEDVPRKIKTRIAPNYPESARRMSLLGTVKVQVVVAPDRTVRNVTLVGGHPLLANAALDAVKKWR
jgi:outer membrane biosynthesis protein TonB